jgi:hypothetical protein
MSTSDKAYSIITKEDTTKGGKSAHEVRFDSDRRLDPIDIGRARDDHWASSASRHDDGGVMCTVWVRKRLCT